MKFEIAPVFFFFFKLYNDNNQSYKRTFSACDFGMLIERNPLSASERVDN